MRAGARRVVAALLGAALLTGTAAAADAATAEQFNDVKDLLEQYHLSNPTDDELYDGAIQGMVNALKDPYTEYFTADQWKSFTNAVEQTYVGVGLVTVLEDGKFYVEDVVPGGAADKAGMQVGDELVLVDGRSFAGRTLTDLNKAIVGDAGTGVVIAAKRGGRSLTFTLVRGDVQLPIVTSALLGDGVGYLKLGSFSQNAADPFGKQLAELESKGIRSLVLDLRDNGGGYVDTAKKIAENFIDKGTLATLTERDGSENPIALSGVRKPYAVYVLVNGNTASASELLSGALQDYGIAKLIGTRTYGKGVVQQVIDVASGGVLKVTIEEYKTPNGHKVDHTGLTPDVAVDGDMQQFIAAYRAAGGRSFTVQAGYGSIAIDGVRGAASAVVRDGGAAYFNLKLAAALAGADVRYSAPDRMIEWTRAGRTIRIGTADAGIRIAGGASYVSVRLLAEWLGGNMSWTDLNGWLRLDWRQ